MKEYFIRSNTPAQNSEKGWRTEAYYTANGYMGICVFGDITQNRIQLSEKTLYNAPGDYMQDRFCAGLEAMGDIYIDACCEHSRDYSRRMCLNTGIITDSYTAFGVKWEREYFVSYPAKIACVHIKTDSPVSFRIRLLPPPDREFLMKQGDGIGRKSELSCEGHMLKMTGELTQQRVKYLCCVSAVGDGSYKVSTNGINVSASTETTVYFNYGTNYKLCEDICNNPDIAAFMQGLPLPVKELTDTHNTARVRSYTDLKNEHIADFSGFMNRMGFDIGGVDDGRNTADLIEALRQGREEPYLVELAFQVGRYMTVCSSREGYTPSHLQAAWAFHYCPNWCSGLWYNENEQMNYFPTFVTNLSELFLPYAEFNRVRMREAQNQASNNIKKFFPERYSDEKGANGWIVGTGNTPYKMDSIGFHSGSGIGGFTTTAYADWYEFTHDKAAVVKYIYPMLEGLARFYSKYVTKNEDGYYLCAHSFSPEQMVEGVGYETLGCAFDQQMMYENNRALLELYDAEKDILPDADTELLGEIREQIDYYDGVQIGADGQIKEYREEEHYGEIGEKHHRHISHLLGLYPGKRIGQHTPKWLKAAYKTLELRGMYEHNKSWSVAHKLAMVARCLVGNTAHKLLTMLIAQHIMPNMWTDHENYDEAESDGIIHAFQCDSNFGLCAAVAEMLIQSHSGYISFLPTLPDIWNKGSVEGICARGGFVLDFEWEANKATKALVKSQCGMPCSIYTAEAIVVTSEGKEINITRTGDVVTFETQQDKVYRLKWSR